MIRMIRTIRARRSNARATLAALVLCGGLATAALATETAAAAPGVEVTTSVVDPGPPVDLGRRGWWAATVCSFATSISKLDPSFREGAAMICEFLASMDGL